jgi:hypothetical protein
MCWNRKLQLLLYLQPASVTATVLPTSVAFHLGLQHDSCHVTPAACTASAAVQYNCMVLIGAST